MSESINKFIYEVFGYETADISLEYIKSGLTNENYFMIHKSEKYVIRISNSQIGELSINREAELAAMNRATTIGICPEIVYFSTSSGNMITKYINGIEWTKEEFCNQNTIQMIISILKKVHNLPSIPYQFSPYDDIENRINAAKSKNLALPCGIDYLLDKMNEIKDERVKCSSKYTGLCHNDPFANNFLYDGMVHLLDWEFAGMGDIFFDLACLVKDYTEEQKEFMLKCYFGECTPDLLYNLNQMRFIVKFWNAMWATLRAQNQQQGFDYSRMAKNIFCSMETT